MTLAVVRDRLRSGRKPPRDIVLAFLADEEAGGTYGARYLVDKHPDLFEGVTEAIGEVGGFSFTVNENLRLYLVETAQKGMHWMRLDRGRHRRPRLDDQQRQRDHRAVRGGRAAGAAQVPGAGHQDGAAVPRRAVATRSAPSSTPRTWRRRSPSSAASPR